MFPAALQISTSTIKFLRPDAELQCEWPLPPLIKIQSLLLSYGDDPRLSTTSRVGTGSELAEFLPNPLLPDRLHKTREDLLYVTHAQAGDTEN